MSEASAPVTTTSEPSNVVRIAPGEQGEDALVGAYLQAQRATCAWRVVNYWYVLLGGIAALTGALLGDFFCGPAPLPPDWVVSGSLADWANRLFGHPWGVLGGSAVAVGLVGLIGAWRRPHGIPAAHEPWMAWPAFAILYLLLHDPLVAISLVAGLLCVGYFAAVVFRLIALLAGGRNVVDDGPDPEVWPMYTILVPLYKEIAVASKILKSLQALDYPADKLDVKILLEADDPETLDALAQAGIPDWIEVLVVPDAQPKTKPRACNHGLTAARGEFLVIYDAEDRPEPDQLKKSVRAYRQLPQSVACLQAQLAYHNHNQNLLTRWFALEYNIWFQRYLPGLVRLAAPIPLGGTSNHFRTDVLREHDGWDPFNVTEDCDLGIRLHATGYRTRTLDSITWEEANSRLGNWVRQRSRWLKGYMITHLVWLRRPLWLFRHLGPWGFFAFWCCIFGVGFLSVFNAPLWLALAAILIFLTVDAAAGVSPLVALTTPDFAGTRASWQMIFVGPDQDPLWSGLSVAFFVASLILFLSNFLLVAATVVFGRRPGQHGLVVPGLISPLYWVLIALAAWKGAWQLVFSPHYWEKTVHGLDHDDEAPAAES